MQAITQIKQKIWGVIDKGRININPDGTFAPKATHTIILPGFTDVVDEYLCKDIT